MDAATLQVKRITVDHYHRALRQLREYNMIRRAIVLLRDASVSAGITTELARMASDVLSDYNESRLLVQYGEMNTGLQLSHRLPAVDPPQNQPTT
ncbi:hypothetical protein [Lacticaseibacillus pantheris]